MTQNEHEVAIISDRGVEYGVLEGNTIRVTKPVPPKKDVGSCPHDALGWNEVRGVVCMKCDVELTGMTYHIAQLVYAALMGDDITVLTEHCVGIPAAIARLRDSR